MLDGLALLLAEAHPQVQEKKEDTDTRVGHLQYQSPLATAAENELGPAESVVQDAEAMVERLTELVRHWPRPVEQDARTTILRLLALLNERHERIATLWENHCQLVAVLRGCADLFEDRALDDLAIAVRDQVLAALALADGGTQPPSGLRGDPGGLGTVNAEARDPSSSSSHSPAPVTPTEDQT